MATFKFGTPARRLSLRAQLGPDKHVDALTTLYLALFQGDPFGSGIEPSSVGGYARVAILNNLSLWGTIGAGQVIVSNLVAPTFPVATGVYSITTALDYWAVLDNAAGGALWYGGPLTPTILVTGAGDQPRLPIGSWVIGQGA